MRQRLWPASDPRRVSPAHPRVAGSICVMIAQITFFQSREDEHGLVRLDDGGEQGRSVRIAHGAFRDLCGVVERRVPERDRVVLLMNFLQRQVRVEVPERWVRPQ